MCGGKGGKSIVWGVERLKEGLCVSEGGKYFILRRKGRVQKKVWGGVLRRLDNT